MAKKKSEFDTLNDKLDRVIDTMATKDDIVFLDKRIDAVIDEMATKDDIARLDARMDALERKFDDRFNKVMTAIDALTKAVTDLRLEYMVINTQLNRHEEWIRLLAKKMGVKLE